MPLQLRSLRIHFASICLSPPPTPPVSPSLLLSFHFSFLSLPPGFVFVPLPRSAQPRGVVVGYRVFYTFVFPFWVLYVRFVLSFSLGSVVPRCCLSRWLLPRCRPVRVPTGSGLAGRLLPRPLFCLVWWSGGCVPFSVWFRSWCFPLAASSPFGGWVFLLSSWFALLPCPMRFDLRWR